MNTGSDRQNGAALNFTVASGRTGRMEYRFAKSTKGGTADVYLDGVFRQTVSYKGSTGTMQSPQFGSSVSYPGLTSGSHVFELRNLQGVAYVDAFCLESSSSNAQPASGPGQTTSGNSTLAVGQQAIQQLPLPGGAQAIAIVAEASANVPIQLVLIDPSGSVLTTANSSAGLAVIEMPVSTAGTYLVKLVNVSAGPVTVWTAATPLVAR